MNEILRPTLSVIITESVLYNEFIWEKIASGHDKMFRMHFRWNICRKPKHIIFLPNFLMMWSQCFIIWQHSPLCHAVVYKRFFCPQAEKKIWMSTTYFTSWINLHQLKFPEWKWNDAYLNGTKYLYIPYHFSNVPQKAFFFFFLSVLGWGGNCPLCNHVWWCWS